jgi:hypothetical protein
MAGGRGAKVGEGGGCRGGRGVGGGREEEDEGGDGARAGVRGMAGWGGVGGSRPRGRWGALSQTLHLSEDGRGRPPGRAEDKLLTAPFATATSGPPRLHRITPISCGLTALTAGQAASGMRLLVAGASVGGRSPNDSGSCSVFYYTSTRSRLYASVRIVYGKLYAVRYCSYRERGTRRERREAEESNLDVTWYFGRGRDRLCPKHARIVSTLHPFK